MSHNEKIQITHDDIDRRNLPAAEPTSVENRTSQNVIRVTDADIAAMKTEVHSPALSCSKSISLLRTFRPAWAIGIVLIGTILGLIIGFATKPAAPKHDANMDAYILLQSLDSTVSNDKAKTIAQSANQMATDPDLRVITDYAYHIFFLGSEAGIRDIQEYQSLKGLLKAIITGYRRPEMGLRGLGLAASSWLDDVPKLIDKVNERYSPLVKEYQRHLEAKPRNAIPWIVAIVFIITTAGLRLAYIAVMRRT